MSSRWLHGDSLLRPQSEWRAAIGGELGARLSPIRPGKSSRFCGTSTRSRPAWTGTTAPHTPMKPGADLHDERARVRQYADAIVLRYPLAGRGETDLFVAFTQMMVELADGDAGIAALLRPASSAPSRRRPLRGLLLDRFGEVSFTVLDNKSRFFEIDTRFKFVAMTAQQRRPGARPAVRIGYGQSSASGCKPGPLSTIDRPTLERSRPRAFDPGSARGVEECWELFQRMTLAGQPWSDQASPWWPRTVREVDMTRERRAFLEYPTASAVPLIEGRIWVHQFRFGAKVYVEGSGRRAAWAPVALGTSSVRPQFWIAGRIFLRLRVNASTRLGLASANIHPDERAIDDGGGDSRWRGLWR